MSMNSLDPAIITNITFGYADSEDRLWARLILEDKSETMLWLTRALCQACCNGLASLLEERLSKDNVSIVSIEDQKKYIRAEFFEAKTSTWSPTPPPPNKKSASEFKPSNGKLCHTIQITPGMIWQIKFCPPQDHAMALTLNRQQAHKILAALLLQTQRARWNLTLEKEWLC